MYQVCFIVSDTDECRCGEEEETLVHQISGTKRRAVDNVVGTTLLEGTLDLKVVEESNSFLFIYYVIPVCEIGQ